MSRDAGSETIAPEFPLSHAQRSLWLLKLIDEADPRQHLPMWFEFWQAVDRDRMEEALHLVVVRHDALRMVFSSGPDGPVQTAVALRLSALPFSDLSHLAEPAAEFELRIAAENGVAFDFDRPLLRVHLYKLADWRYRIYLNVHHLVSDGLSNGILQRELRSALESLDSGRAPRLPELPTSYGDHVRTEQAWLASPESQPDADYWREELALPLPRLRLADGGRPPGAPDGADAASTGFTLPAAMSTAVRTTARELRVTVNTLLMAVYAIALRHLTGDDELVIGIPFSGRHHPDLADAVGLFTNPVAIRLDLARATTFAAAVGLVRDKTLLAYEHSRYPFDLVVEQVNPPRDEGRNPVFLTFFQFTDFLPPKHMAPQVDVGLYGKATADRLEFRLNYHAARLTSERVDRLSAVFSEAVAWAVRDPSAALDGFGQREPQEHSAGQPPSGASAVRAGRLQHLIDIRTRQQER
jgi:hypothetical protein